MWHSHPTEPSLGKFAWHSWAVLRSLVSKPDFVLRVELPCLSAHHHHNLLISSEANHCPTETIHVPTTVRRISEIKHGGLYGPYISIRFVGIVDSNEIEFERRGPGRAPEYSLHWVCQSKSVLHIQVGFEAGFGAILAILST